MTYRILMRMPMKPFEFYIFVAYIDISDTDIKDEPYLINLLKGYITEGYSNKLVLAPIYTPTKEAE